MPNVQELAAPVKLLLMDVDGVLTDGKLINVPDAAGNMVETKAFDSQDGIGLQWLSWKGIKTGLISGRVSPVAPQARPRSTLQRWGWRRQKRRHFWLPLTWRSPSDVDT